MNQRQNLPSEATYAQCGRQHFHPTFAVATSEGSMISPWPKEQQRHPERKSRVTNTHQKKRKKPPLWKVRENKRLISTLWPSVGGRGKSLGVPRKSGGPACVPTDVHITLSRGYLPLPGTSSQEASVGFTGAPPAGDSTETKALPSHHSAKGSPQVRKRGACGRDQLSNCVG